MGKKETRIIVEEVFKSKNEKDKKEKFNHILMDVIKKSSAESIHKSKNKK
ncbi:MAG: hypothetical protein MJA31_09705 [Clostridia bacterium]|nr:hypothetical protein [Clostridia bacterium]